MAGLWHVVDAMLSGLFNRGGPPKGGPPSCTETPKGHFHIGTARPFGNEAPSDGEPVTAPFEVFKKHLSVAGASGCGKSTFATNVREAFVAAGITVIDIDFRGDGFDQAAAQLLALEHPIEKTTFIDLRADRISPLNFLGFGPGNAHSRAAVVYGALKDSAESWGVLLSMDLRCSLIALASIRGSLLDVTTVLSPEGASLRERLIIEVKDDYALDWLRSYHPIDEAVMRNRAAAVTNKLDEYLCHPVLRMALAADGAPNFDAIMNDPGHVTLVALAADRNPQAGLIGRLLVASIQRSAMSRVDQLEEARNLTFLIIDEAQNFVNSDTCHILAEGRRFRLGLSLFTQFADALPSDLKDSMKVNCATQLQFQTSAAQANEVAAEVVSSLSRDEIRKTLLAAPVGAALVLRGGSRP